MTFCETPNTPKISLSAFLTAITFYPAMFPLSMSSSLLHWCLDILLTIGLTFNPFISVGLMCFSLEKSPLLLKPIENNANTLKHRNSLFVIESWFRSSFLLILFLCTQHIPPFSHRVEKIYIYNCELYSFYRTIFIIHPCQGIIFIFNGLVFYQINAAQFNQPFLYYFQIFALFCFSILHCHESVG